jgi:GNAT superfamily N-acetyltransferase
VPGRGLEGDRYYLNRGTFTPASPKPDHELTLIEHEAIDAFAQESGLAFTALDARRNVVTKGVRLNGLVGREFSIGSVRIKGLRLCEPCNYLAKTTHPEVLRGLVHRGGLRAQIVSENIIRVGDPIGTASPMSHESHHDGYRLSDDPARLQIDVIHRYLAEDSYWAGGVPRNVVEQAVQNSLCIGIYAASGDQVGLGRVVTDYATYAWLCDVFVLPAHRERGLGKALMRTILTHPRLQGLRRFALATQDAHGLYAQFGFTPLADPARHMEKRLLHGYNQAS